MKRNIAIVAGGDTSEIVVSLRSAQGIYSFIDKEKYNLYIVEMEGRRWEVQLPDGNKVPVDRNDFSFTNGTEKVVFDFAYITIHGTPGEDGRLQGYFDMMRIPYSCCGVLAAAITYDKFTCNQYLKAFGVRIAESLLLRQGQSVSDEEVVEKIGLPCFIKPSLGGSSFGVTKVKTKEQIQPAIVKAFGEAEEVIVEAFMDGTELTCGCYRERPFFVEKFKEEIPRYMIKHQVRPGLTGWAQVNGYRGNTSIRKRIEYDLYYIENWTLGLDVKILFLTIFKGFINKNAY